jgi:hypothetical protein
MADLREEVIESEKVRSDLLKWKLIITSALGGVGLGFGDHVPENGMPLMLALIPLSCAYVDLQCRHLTMRIQVIGAYSRSATKAAEGNYEQFAEECRAMGEGKKLSAFELEDLALEWSTFVLSLLVIGFGVVSGIASCGPEWCVSFNALVLTVAGTLGLVLTLIVRGRYRKLLAALKALAAAKARK